MHNLASARDTKFRSEAPIILLGPPGAGKGTQAKRIAAECDIAHVSTGEVFRRHLEDNTDLGRLARNMIDRGTLVTDGLVCDMVENRIRQPDCVRGAILDGFPRTIIQAQWLDNYLSEPTSNHHRWDRSPLLVIKINLARDELFRRLAGRRSCPACGMVYNTRLKLPGTAEVCESDGTKLIARHDDVEDLIRKRLEIYEHETLPVVEYYRRKGQLHEIDGNCPIEFVLAETLAIVRNRENGTRLAREGSKS